MTYPQWWERLVAAIIDGLIIGVPWVIINVILQSIAGYSVALIIVMSLISAVIYVGAFVAYKVIMETSPRQATLGKMVFGLQLVDGAGNRVGQQQALMRTWPWWVPGAMIVFGLLGVLGTLLNLLLAIGLIVNYALFFVDPKGRCFHDQTANCNVIKTGPGMVSQS
jgi:uncharacterized RDD family membrane protein YckC